MEQESDTPQNGTSKKYKLIRRTERIDEKLNVFRDFKILVKQLPDSKLAIWEIDVVEATRVIEAFKLLQSRTCTAKDIWMLSLNGGGMQICPGRINGAKVKEGCWYKATIFEMPKKDHEFCTGVDIYLDEKIVGSFRDGAVQVDFPLLGQLRIMAKDKPPTVPDAPGRVLITELGDNHTRPPETI